MNTINEIDRVTGQSPCDSSLSNETPETYEMFVGDKEAHAKVLKHNCNCLSRPKLSHSTVNNPIGKVMLPGFAYGMIWKCETCSDVYKVIRTKGYYNGRIFYPGYPSWKRLGLIKGKWKTRKKAETISVAKPDPSRLNLPVHPEDGERELYVHTPDLLKKGLPARPLSDDDVLIYREPLSEWEKGFTFRVLSPLVDKDRRVAVQVDTSQGPKNINIKLISNRIDNDKIQFIHADGSEILLEGQESLDTDGDQE